MQFRHKLLTFDAIFALKFVPNVCRKWMQKRQHKGAGTKTHKCLVEKKYEIDTSKEGIFHIKDQI